MRFWFGIPLTVPYSPVNSLVPVRLPELSYPVD